MSRRSWRAELCDAGNNKEKESLAKSAKVAKQEDNHEDHRATIQTPNTEPPTPSSPISNFHFPFSTIAGFFFQ